MPAVNETFKTFIAAIGKRARACASRPVTRPATIGGGAKSTFKLMRLEIERVLNMLSEVKPHEIEDLLKKTASEEEDLL